jgi:hypothetical protein
LLGNYPKFPIKKNKNNSNFNSLNYIKLGKIKENAKNRNNHKYNDIIKKSKKSSQDKNNNKRLKINNRKIYGYNNDNKKFYRNNNFQISCKHINKTEINSINNNKKQKRKNNFHLKNIDIIKNNKKEEEDTYKEEKKIIDDEKEEIKVNKLDEIYYLSENSNINKKFNCESEKDEEEEEEEDSNILSLDDVQDIIQYYDFAKIDKDDNYLFYNNDYQDFMLQKKYLIYDEFFDKSKSSELTNNKANKKKFENKYGLNTYYKKFDARSPININSQNKNYRTFKK